MDVIPIQQGNQAPAGLPDPARGQGDALSSAEADRLAKETREFHQKGLTSRRLRDITCEKYMLHVDGEGLSQYLDVYHGTRLKMVPNLEGIARAQDNQLRPILDNFVAHLTTQPFYFTVQPKPDRASRQAAVVDQALVNADVRAQSWNALWREAKYIAACTGFCPVHSMWRDDPTHDQYEGLKAQGGPLPGRIDSWVGNPFDTIFNGGAKRGSVHRQTYGRVLPADMVRSAFGRPDLEGSDKLVNVSTFQRVVQKWRLTGGFVHGTAALSTGEGHDELIALLYDEILPGVLPDYPAGVLRIVAIQGAAATDPTDARGTTGQATMLWEGPLPAGVFSSVNVYSHHRFDDVHGKPYIGDIDDDQIELNQLESMFNEFVRRATKPPLASSGAVSVDTISYRGDTLLEVEALTQGKVELRYLEYPARHMPVLEGKIKRVAEGMYRKAGWQAASRGETGGESGKAIIALQRADDSIFGPIAGVTKEELEAFARLNWRLRKEFMDVPMVLDVIGDDLAHMAEPYVDRTMMADEPPVFSLTSAFGTSSEAQAQQILNLLAVTDVYGEPLLTARQARKKWPDSTLWVEVDDPQAVRERRPRAINEMLRSEANNLTEQFQAQNPAWQPSYSDPFTAQVGQLAALNVDASEPALPDDDYPLHIEFLSVMTQDPQENPVARWAARTRQEQYWMVLAMQQQAQSEQAVQEQAAGQAAKEQVKAGAPNAEEAFNPAREGGTPTAEGMVQADRDFSRRTA